MKIQPPVTLQEIATIIEAKLVGSPEHLVSGLNEIHMVESGDIVFVDHPKYYSKALHSKATTILINKEVDRPEGKALLVSDDPFRDFNRLIKHFNLQTYSSKSISDTARIGKNTLILPGAIIGDNVVIGNNCIIHPNVVIYNNCMIGNNVIIHSGTIIGADAFYYKKRPDLLDKLISCGSVIISDDVEIGALCTIDRGVTGNTEIGNGTKIDNHVQVGHDTIIGQRCIIASQVGIAGVVKIGDEVTLWGQVGISSDITIGKGAVVLAQSGVGSSIKPGQVFFGSPATESKEKLKEIMLLRRLPGIVEKMNKDGVQ